MCDGQFAVFLAQATPVGETGTSTPTPSLDEPFRMDPMLNNTLGADTNLRAESDVSSLHARISELEDKITDLQRDLRMQDHVAQRASANEDFMLTQVKRAAEQLACECASCPLLISDAL